jgi:hypothetical protein
LKVFVDGFFDGCCHCILAGFTECHGEWSRLVATRASQVLRGFFKSNLKNGIIL